jgi:hypothetical protein
MFTKFGETARLESPESLILFSDWLAQFKKNSTNGLSKPLSHVFFKDGGCTPSRYLNM